MKKRIAPHLNAHNAFMIIAIVFGLFFLRTTPLLWGADETTQLGRAYQVSQGHVQPELFGIFHGGGYGGQMPQAFINLIYYVNEDITTHSRENSNGVGQVNNPSGYKALAAQKIGPPKTLYVFSNTAPYSPLVYAPSALGLRLGIAGGFDVGNTIHLARLFDLLSYILIIGLALKSLRRTNIKWIIFAVALLPMSLFQASIITADSLTIAVSLLLVALAAKGFLTDDDFTKSDKVLLALSIISLPLLKPTYLPLIFLVLLIPGKKLSKSYQVANTFKSILLFASICFFGFWSYETRNITDTLRLVIPGPVWDTINPKQQEHFLIRHEFSYLLTIARTFLIYDNAYFTQFFGLLGFNYVAIPAVSIIASFISLILALVLSSGIKQRVSKMKLTSIFVVVAASVLFMLTTFYITLSTVGTTVIGGLQGRYFIPLAAPTLLGLGLLIPRIKISSADYKKLYRHATVLLVALIVFSLTLSAIKYYYFTFG